MYGIVKQNNGFIWVYGEPGSGTVFKIYLPCVNDGNLLSDTDSSECQSEVGGSETILLVEDEAAVRGATAEYLRLQGYNVIEARDGLDALSLAQGHSQIHLVVTDVVMPRMSGGTLAKEMARMRPKTQFVFVSGYAGKTILDHKVVDLETNFLQKPYSLKQLCSKIRKALNSVQAGHPRN